MRKIILALLIGSLAAIPFKLSAADQLVADATANFEPAHPASAAPAAPENPSQPTVKPQPPAKPAAPSAPAKTAATPTSTSVASPDVTRTAQEELVRRQAAQAQARTLIDEGQKLYQAGKYSEAVPKLESAIRILPRAKATDADYNRATRTLADSYDRLAQAAYAANDFVRAQTYSKKALEYDPQDRAAENMIVKAKKAELNPPGPAPMTPPSQDPEFQAKQADVRALFREGKLLMNSGQFDEAEKRFQQILLVDPYNTDAFEFLNRINVERESSTSEGITANRNRMLWQADHGWLAPLTGAAKQPDAGGPGGRLSPTTAASTVILQKLNEIIFPEIKFRDATITDVVQYLGDESRKLDPKHEGVNIVLGAGVSGGGGAEPLPVTPAPEAGGAAPAAPAAGGGGGRTVTLNLHNVPMIEALKYITSLANLKYRIESSAVLIVRADEPSGDMITRTYPVTPGAFSTITTGTGVGGAAPQARAGGEEFVRIGTGSSATPSVQDVKVLFEGAGVVFPPGATISYNERTSTLIVKNTPENIELLERVLPAFIDIPKQIEIEAKFVEISQSDLDELGFSWKVGPYQNGDIVVEGGNSSVVFPTQVPNPNNVDDITGGNRDSSSLAGNAIDALLGGAGIATGGNTVGAIRGILTDPQFEVIIKALSQKKSADTLSAPKVTTISGVQAQIKVVQEFIYPTEFSEPQVGNSGITPSIPSAFKTREVGVILNVTPTVGADNYTINLTLIPEVSEFLGFINYSPGNVTSVGTNGSTISTPFLIEQPLFSSRNVTTTVVLWDGQTVVLGGLIREEVSKIDDKVPFLGDLPGIGRLFRSKVTSRGKRNLLIFVTARLIDPAGNPIHKEPPRSAAAR